MSAKKSSNTTQRHALALTLKRQFFDEIAAGEKKIEYREYKEFWRNRLIGIKYREVHFRNGFVPPIPFMRVECRGISVFGKGRGRYFGIRLGRILELKKL